MTTKYEFDLTLFTLADYLEYLPLFSGYIQHTSKKAVEGNGGDSKVHGYFFRYGN